MTREFPILLLVFSIFNQYQPSHSFDLHQNYKSVTSLARKLYAANFSEENIGERKQFLNGEISKINSLLSIDGHILQVLREITSVSRKIDKITHSDDALRSISGAISSVESDYDRFLTYSELKPFLLRRSYVIENFAKFMVGPRGLRPHLAEINSKFVQSRHASNKESTIPRMLLNYLQDYEYLCNKGKSMSMIISELYDVLMKVEIKSLMIMNFAFDILKKYDFGQNYDYESDKIMMGEISDTRIEKMRETLLGAASKASRAIWTCDPKRDTDRAVLGETTQQKSHIYFNLSPVWTNVVEWMVMTGARFNRRKIIVNEEEAEEIYLEIQQGKLLQDGTIDPSTLEWKNNLKIRHPKRYPLQVNKSKVNLMAQDNVLSYVYLTGLQLRLEDGNTIVMRTFGMQDPWKIQGEMKSVDFPDFALPLDKREQGISPSLRDLVSFLNDTRSYSYITNSYLGLDDSTRKRRGSTQKLYKIPPNRLIINGGSTDQCKKQQSRNLTRYFGQFTFQESQVSEERAEKVIVPYIDLQEVVTNPPRPLSGAALYHKGSPGCENYLAIELRTRSHENRTMATQR